MVQGNRAARARPCAIGGDIMKPFSATVLGAALLLAPLAALPGGPAAAQTPPSIAKINAYVGCINRLSARAFQSRSRYFSWAAKSGPTGQERIIYGTYTIYDTSDCVKTSRRPIRWSRTTPSSKPPPPLTPKPPPSSRRCSRRPTTTTPSRTTRTTRWPRAAPCIHCSSPPGTPSPAPTRSCAAASKPSTTSARWRNSPPSSKAKASRRATMSRR